jgi:hypothetical protein
MSVPLDQLYNFIDNINNHDLLIYRWYPHGSKNIEHLTPIKYYQQIHQNYIFTHPVMICHDQEPLDLDQYSEKILNAGISKWRGTQCISDSVEVPPEVLDFINSRLNFNQFINANINLYDYNILLHSELNSTQVEKCQDQYVPVYYWSHAIIARDWFRYAAIDPLLSSDKQYTHDFLIYNRAWSGTREYRLKFSEMIINSQLYQNCKMGFSTIDNSIHYANHKFKNPNFYITNHRIQDYFFDNQTPSSASADFNSIDYQSCAVEVVLETLFDDTRIYLTEKILRPIACGQPFILVSTPGSLEYLRNYGFQTFDGLIDENYDFIKNPTDRLQAVVDIMKNISSLPSDEKSALFAKMMEIAKYNQKRFFSDEFQYQIIQELKTNLDAGMKKMYQHRTGKNFREKIKFTVSQGSRLWPNVISRQQCVELWNWIRQHN